MGDSLPAVLFHVPYEKSLANSFGALHILPSVQDDRVDDGRHEVLLEHAAMIRLARRHAAVLCLAGTGRLSAVGKSQRAGEESVHHKSKNRP